MIFISLIIGAVMFAFGAASLCAGNVLDALICFAVCFAFLDAVKHEEELEYLRSELKRLHETQHIDEVI